MKTYFLIVIMIIGITIPATSQVLETIDAIVNNELILSGEVDSAAYATWRCGS